MARDKRCEGVIVNAKRSDIGQRCKRWAVNGKNVCAVHGGAEMGGFANPESLEHRCIARSVRTGSQCKRPALRGTTVCRTHGGQAKQVQGKAQELLDRMVEPVLWQLRDIALRPGTSDSDRLRAMQMVLDRAMPRERKVEVELKPWEVTIQSLFKESPAVGVMREPPAELTQQITDYTPTFDDIEDADVIEDEPEPVPSNVTSFYTRKPKDIVTFH
ncbi:MAG TPA: hypothetical protein VFU07_07820 [Candidatus Lumbricidophila sp.]|nr:hypothetical protein [Candidatus Lumbricidophila sp.]